MYIAAAITFIGLAVSWLLAPETNAKNLEEAAALDESPVAKRVLTPNLPKRNSW